MQSFKLEKIQTRICRLRWVSLPEAISDMRPVLFFLIIFMVVSCSSSAKKNTYLLSDEELAHVLFDMHYADVILPELHGERADTVKAIFWKRMIDIYGLSEEEIRTEIDKLESEPETMKLVIGRVKELADS